MKIIKHNQATAGTYKFSYSICMLCFLMLTLNARVALAQAEFTTWGNLTGIRVEGQLMEFETSVCTVNKDWTTIHQTARERQYINFSREKNRQVFEYLLDSIKAINKIESIATGVATIEMEYTPVASKNISGVFYRIDLPAKYYAEANLHITGGADIKLTSDEVKTQTEYYRGNGTGINLESKKRQLKIMLQEATEIIIRSDRTKGNTDIQIYISVLPPDAKKGETVKKHITITASGEIDKEEIKLTLDTSKAGNIFDGLGGNFRLQNEKTDPPVIDYCLANLRVSWGRVEMPWRFWQPEEGMNPASNAKAGKLHPKVQSAMEMAQRLSKKEIPIILSNWSAPDWAIEGEYTPRPVNGIWGNPLNQQKAQKIYESIGAYILYLKENYGVTIEAFSFNESDLGINVRQTPEEHKQLIKGLGQYLSSKGLKTKLLLGDTADVTGWAFTDAAAADEGAYPYIAAVSFHSWRGYTDENLAKWASIAKRINKPLLVGEGSIDAGAWRYPAIFEEPTYAIDEINLYVKIISICQPLSILQWQLTADYSPLSGGGVFGNTKTPLHPTQRFWNLKQLASTPAKLSVMQISSSNADVTCAALGDNLKNVYAIHLVNNGSARTVTITGLPHTVKGLRKYSTNSKLTMEEDKFISVVNGEAKFALNASSFVSLMTLVK